MRTYVLFLIIFTCITFSFQTRAAEFFGQLKSGEGACSLEIKKQDKNFYEIIYTTPEARLRAFNLKLKNGKFESFTHYFERHGDRYHQLRKPMPIYPRTYLITMKNLGKGRMLISKTNLVFGDPTITKKDICDLVL